MYVASWCSTCFCVVLCVGFCTGHIVMVLLNLTYLHCLQHSFFEFFFNLYILISIKSFISLYYYYIINVRNVSSVVVLCFKKQQHILDVTDTEFLSYVQHLIIFPCVQWQSVRIIFLENNLL